MGQIDEIISKVIKFYENLGYTVYKVNFNSGSVTIECSKPEKITFIWKDE